jgi:NAD(P)-dependent dehydrogenase (short-subunit alcohol dehydrogenase family)
MARIFITGSTDGLGLAAARSLIADGHQVLLHARTAERRATIDEVADQAAGVLVGDLSRGEDVRGIAEQANAIGRMDAVIHNAGIYHAPARGQTPEGHAVTIAVNLLAPYMLTALMERPERLIYLSSGRIVAVARARWTISTGRSAPGMRAAPMPRVSCT